jgi:uncharacterized protein YndB with AHSA1/START domain
MEIHTTSASVEIDASPERVWAVVSDITVMPRFSTELLAVQWAEGFTEPGLGAKFVGTNHHPAIGRWQTTSEITAFDPPTVFAWAVGRPEMAAATWRFDLTPTATGTTTKYTAAIGPGPSGVTMLIERSPDRAEQIVRDRLAHLGKAMAATLTGIRTIAEGAW